MLDVLSTILNFINSIIHLIINFFTGLISLILHIPIYIAFLTTAIGFLPAMLVPFLVASVSIYVVLFILGRT